jgi:hypothetical protein
MPDRFTTHGRAERAFEDYFAARASATDFPPLDPAALTVRRRRRRPRVLGAVAAVAAVALVAVVLVAVQPTAPSRVVPAGPAMPGETGTWVRTSAGPLGQRYRAVTLWAGGTFYVIGGTSHCGLDAKGNTVSGEAVCGLSLPSAGEAFADGARYDPATDTWRRIADAPEPIVSGQGVVVAGAIYVIGTGRDVYGTVLRYDPAGDRWDRLPQPGSSLRQLLTWSGELYVVEGTDDAVQRWDGQAWQPVPEWRPAEAVAAVTDGLVAIEESRRDGSERTAALYRDNRWTRLPSLPFTQSVEWFGAVGDVVVAVGWGDRSYSLDLDDDNPAWRRLPTPSAAGGLARESGPRFADGQHVVVGGQLYDPMSGAWTDVPELPYAGWSFGAFASNGTQVLACFIGGRGSMDDCYLLTLPASSTGEPPAAIEEWTTAADPPLAPRVGAVTATIDEQFVVVGGRCPGSEECPDAAAYDPMEGTWRSLARPPLAFDDTATWSVLGSVLYVAPASGKGVWGYDATADQWTQLPALPTGTTVQQLVTDGSVLLALGETPADDAYLDPGSGRWADVPDDPYPAGTTRLAAFTGKELIVGASSGTSGLQFTVFFQTAEHRPPTDPGEPLASLSAAGGRMVSAPSAATVFFPSDGSMPLLRAGGAEKWKAVPQRDRERGPLADGTSGGDWIVVTGHLFDGNTETWRTLPALSGGATGAGVQVISDDVILACFPLGDDRPTAGCSLLRL